jgi:Flp pilus assembly protein TadG
VTARRRPIRRLARVREGTVALEFALLAVPFLMLSFGIIEFGRLMWASEALQATAAIGARCMGVLASSCSSSGAYSSSASSTYIVSVASGWNVTIPTSALTLTTNGTCGGVTGFSEVTITYSFQTVVPLLLNSLAAGIPLNVSACFPNQA